MSGYYIEHPDEIFSMATLEAGGVFYGGLLGALAVAGWYMRKTRLPALTDCRRVRPGHSAGPRHRPAGLFFRRLLLGTECQRAVGGTFTNPVANALVGVPLGVPLHPTQLYEALAEFAIFGDPLFPRPQSPRAGRYHQPLHPALRRGAIRGGVLPIPRARQPVGRPAGHVAMDFARPDGGRRGALRGGREERKTRAQRQVKAAEGRIWK